MRNPKARSKRSVKMNLLLAGGMAGGLVAGPASAQTTPGTEVSPTALPTVTVTAQKIPQDADVVPLSVTPVPRQVLQDVGPRMVDDVLIYSPDLYLSEFAPRKNSSPYYRGIGGSPLNPGVTTYIDGVPQLNSNSSSMEFSGIDQVEFIRGAQATLFGRNTIGGVINVTSQRPSSVWTGGGIGQYGNYNYRDIRGDVSGPLLDRQLSLSLDGGYSARDGYSKNVNTGHGVDYRGAEFGKGQLLYNPADNWELRFILSGETSRDGDYPLNDLNALRANPHTVNMRYEGYADRYIFAPTLQLGHMGEAVDFTSTTGGVLWRTYDSTDIDYLGAFPGGAPHVNQEQETQFTQEFRLASAKDKPVKVADGVDLKWQAGVLVFDEDYQQRDQTSVFSDALVKLHNIGVGGYGQGTLTFAEKFDVIAGARVDWENAHADDNYLGATGSNRKDFSEISPQFGLAYHLQPKQTIYGEVTRGYKAGGFNNATATTLASAQTPFGKEHSWDYEVGYKGSFLEDRLSLRAAAFYIDYENVQVNQVSGPQNIIANAGGAASKGLELELAARPVQWLDIFGSFGYTDARFLSGATDSSGGPTVGIGGNKLPYTPDYTASGGAQVTVPVCSAATVYARADITGYGGFAYDNVNGAFQSSYSIANFRAGVRGKMDNVNWFAEGWVRNAFDTKYIPIAISYAFDGPPSGYVGESGAPVTYGLRIGVSF